jgi:hypothetical protein
VPTRELLAPAQRAQFTALPALSERDLARHYTLAAEDLAAINRRRRPHNRLGFAVQFAYLRFPVAPLVPDAGGCPPSGWVGRSRAFRATMAPGRPRRSGTVWPGPS